MTNDTQIAVPAASMTDEARHIARTVRDASTSFYWAMRILPKSQRRAMFAVYAFCRDVDDIVDKVYQSNPLVYGNYERVFYHFATLPNGFFISTS